MGADRGAMRSIIVYQQEGCIIVKSFGYIMNIMYIICVHMRCTTPKEYQKISKVGAKTAMAI